MFVAVTRIPDLLGGDFGASAPDEAWVGDISYIRTRQGFLYVAFVLDLASRRVVGVSMASHMKASLVADALREAIGTRGGQMRSPGRPSKARREDRVRFWEAIAGGVSSEDAAAGAGVSPAVGSR